MVGKESDKIYGLVLSGGKSTRMGKDKSTLAYHGIPQREFLYRLLEQVCDKTFLSVRKDQQPDLLKNFEVILDRDEYKGPYNGLLSAHQQFPDVAWLVLACDLPLINLNAVKQLINARDASKWATAFATAESRLPEPLAAIWEPDALARSIAYLKEGTSSCPRKFLINADCKLVFPENDQILINANSQKDYEAVLSKLSSL